jgi:hypothetical protein
MLRNQKSTAFALLPLAGRLWMLRNGAVNCTLNKYACSETSAGKLSDWLI